MKCKEAVLLTSMDEFRKGIAEYITYLKNCWHVSLELAEELIGQPRTDDQEAHDRRRMLVFNLTCDIFDKLSISAAETLRNQAWQDQIKGAFKS